MNASAEIIYLVGTVLFILGIKKLGKVESSKSGNHFAATGMALGIIIILLVPLNQFERTNTLDYVSALLLIILMLTLGGSVGGIIALKVKLTALPEMVSLLNALGGLCSMLIGIAEGLKLAQTGQTGNIVIPLSIFIGGVTTTGSTIAWGKLSGKVSDHLKPPAPHWINLILLFLNLLLMGIYSFGGGEEILKMIGIEEALSAEHLIIILTTLTLLYGIMFVLPIGGGDMPVVISFLNSMSGIAAAIAGLLFQNIFMITGGILVGASGTFLTILMCKAMNRTLANVLIGGFGASSEGASSAGSQDGHKPVKVINLDDLAVMLKYAKKVIVVPGYGLAVAQAQHLCKEIEKILNDNGVQMYYAIHPVAGRMPGHMNVLLAEAQISYENIIEMEEANTQFSTTGVVLVIGANDVVNTAAKDNPGSPIYGMPILEVGKAETVVILKRGMSAGYAGIDNPLFYAENTRMLFGDAKDSLQKLKQAVAEV